MMNYHNCQHSKVIWLKNVSISEHMNLAKCDGCISAQVFHAEVEQFSINCIPLIQSEIYLHYRNYDCFSRWRGQLLL